MTNGKLNQEALPIYVMNHDITRNYKVSELKTSDTFTDYLKLNIINLFLVGVIYPMKEINHR